MVWKNKLTCLTCSQFLREVGKNVSVLVVIVISDVFWFHVSFFLRIQVYAQNMEENNQEHNEATHDFLFVDPSHGSFVNGGILASFLFQICRSSR